MVASSYEVRRAVVDDRDALVSLWTTMNLPAGELEKRLTEFQVAADPDDKVIGAVGIQLAGKQGLIHSEGYTDFGQADELRPAIWERLQSVATNYGLVRLWTTETAPFWTQSGFNQATEDELKKLPAQWAEGEANWLTLKLREDIDEVVNLDKEFAMFMEAEKQRSRQMMDQAKLLKLLATLLAVALVLGVIGVGLWLFMRNPGTFGR